MQAVGIDVGKHALNVVMAGDRNVRRFPNTQSGIERLRRLLRSRTLRTARLHRCFHSDARRDPDNHEG